MGYQVPKASHPWRQYANRQVEEGAKEIVTGKPVKVFVQEIAESWDSVEVVTTMGSLGKYFLRELTQEKQAAWLSGILKRNYGTY